MHPGSASLAGPRKIVPQEEACESAVLAANLPYFDVLGVSAQVRPRGERQSVKPVRGVEDASFDDVRQLQIGRQRLVVELELLAGERVAEVKPVRRGDRGPGVCLKRLVLGLGVALGGFDHRLEKAVNGLRRSGRFLGGDILGVGGVAEELRLFGPKAREREDDAAGVRRGVAPVAPARRSLENPLADVGAGEGGLDGLLSGKAEDDEAGLAFRQFRVRFGVGRQPGLLGIAQAFGLLLRQRDRSGQLGFERQLPELGRQVRRLLVDRAQPLLGGGVKVAAVCAKRLKAL